ncbi:angiotensin-converting enzyme-like [Dendronephthya gigantea]|uniref:angiotensin-converting enzyme-like n=1 Tax=Dendronephthya gigantea TaxID=151771 RepID=UPI0010697135|nr:angiotensin-converting enzyme-like [Dendronephthya gigantea]
MQFFERISAVSLLFSFLAVAATNGDDNGNQTTQAQAELFLKNAYKILTEYSYKSSLAAWARATNITDYNSQVEIKAYLAYTEVYAEVQKNASKFDLNKLDYDTSRQIRMLSNSTNLKNQTEFEESEKLGSRLSKLYSTAKVGNNSLSPQLVNIMAKSRDYDELLQAWWGWRNESGRKMRDVYRRFVELKNKGARENGYTDRGQAWRGRYEVDDLGNIVEKLWNDLRPLYLEMHAYVRYKLTKTYRGKVLENDYIPAHLLGNMWAQSWVNIYDLVEPYKNKPSLDVTSNLKKDSRYNTPEKLTKLAESFFESIGLKKLPANFYKNSLLQKPKDRDVVCHASAWDFLLYQDVRIKQCVEITHNHLVTLHHELGHIQYYLQYGNLPYVYRTGANPGFHEAVGDLMSLSVDTPGHLETLGLLKDYKSDNEADINALMKMAMRKVAFLPFGYLIDQWRWNVFNGKISEKEYNAKWWELRRKYQGIKPPVPRSEDDFDPGAKYHIPSDTPYIRYFISYVLQFQFHKAACKAAGFKGHLFKCSIHESKAAGKKIGAMLELGKSKPWPIALEKMTGSKNMSVAPIKEYFEPLRKWLVKERCDKKYKVGWPGQSADGVQDCETTSAGVKNVNGKYSSAILLFVASLLQFVVSM